MSLHNVVCERLSVMHEPAGVVEILVQILPEYPYSEFQNTPPPPMNIVRESKSESFRIPPLPENENCQSPKSKSFRIPPPHENCQRVKIREFQRKRKLSESPNPNLTVSEYPSLPQMKNVRESKSPPPPPQSEKLQISNFRIVL